MSKKIECPVTKEELYQLFHIENKSLVQLAEMFSTSRPTIRRWLSLYEIENKSQEKINESVSANQSGRQRNGYEKIYEKLQDRDWLYTQFIIENKSKKKIARELGCSDMIVNNYIKKFNI